jgi:high-affinity nickel-transport protein
MPIVDLVTSSGFGSLLGIRHALEPDHLAAVSTMITGERARYKAAWLGACWGFGHTLSLLVVGALLVLLRAEMPARAAVLFELGVAVMLVALGVRAIYRAAREGPSGPVHAHHHGHVVHTHRGVEPHVHIGSWTLARRPLIVGAIHGLAGSGALTALVLSTLPSTMARLTYIALFGLGSTIGMAALSGVMGWPLAHAVRFRGVTRGVSIAVGCLSTALGLFYGWNALGL